MLTTAAAAPLLVLLSLVGPTDGVKSAPSAEAISWQSLGSGVEHGVVTLPVEASLVESSDEESEGRDAAPRKGVALHVVRIDPALAELRAHLASEPKEHPRTAQAWCKDKGLVAAINLGMYKTDLRSNVGFARKASHRNNGHVNEYRSFLGFGPRKPGLPAAQLWDAEDAGANARLEAYDVVVQNLRLVRAGGVSVWSTEGRRWSEAAIASDKQGRILFLFTGTPLSMLAFTRALVKLPLDIDRAMHVEGGPEASLSLCTPGAALHANGAFIGGVLSGLLAPSQMPIPNIIGVVPRAPRAQTREPRPAATASQN